jgi:hypothetical protein
VEGIFIPHTVDFFKLVSEHLTEAPSLGLFVSFDLREHLRQDCPAAVCLAGAVHSVLQKVRQDCLHLEFLVVLAKINIIDLSPESSKLLLFFFLRKLSVKEKILPDLLTWSFGYKSDTSENKFNLLAFGVLGFWGFGV